MTITKDDFKITEIKLLRSKQKYKATHVNHENIVGYGVTEEEAISSAIKAYLTMLDVTNQNSGSISYDRPTIS